MTNTMLSDLTLIIPTFNRPEHLARLLGYYANQAVTFDILVLDSSCVEIQEINAVNVKIFGVKIRHIKYDSSIRVATKLWDGLSQVATRFSAFCADDDVVFIDGLASAQIYLSSHPDCVCADGIYLNFMRRDAELHTHIEYASQGISAEHPGARVFRLFQRYESLFYGVFRTQDLATIFSAVCVVPTLHFQELFQTVGALLIGKSHRLDVFYAGRQHCDPAEPARDKWQTFYWFADDREDFLMHYLVYRTKLWKFYLENGQEPHITLADFERVMDLAHATFFGVNCPPEYFFNSLGSIWPADHFLDRSDNKYNICNRLKSPLRQKSERMIINFSEYLFSRLNAWQANRAIAHLDLISRLTDGIQWKCSLPDDLRWLADTPTYQTAYKSLCRYFEPSPKI